MRPPSLVPKVSKSFSSYCVSERVVDEAFLLLFGIDLEVPVAPTAAASCLSLLSAHADVWGMYRQDAPPL